MSCLSLSCTDWNTQLRPSTSRSPRKNPNSKSWKILNPKHDHSGKNGLPSTPPSRPCHLYSNLISMESGILSELNIITIKNTKTQAHPIGVLRWQLFCERNTSSLLPSKQTAIIRPHSRFFISFPNVGEHQFPSINHKLATLDTPSWRNHSPGQCWGLKLNFFFLNSSLLTNLSAKSQTCHSWHSFLE